MLFDLRSRGRRRTIQVVYLGLAVLMGGGLVLFGVGTGTGGGGLLNAFGGGGSGGSQSQVVSQQETAALKQLKQNPNDAQAWGSLLQARWTTAINGTDYGPTGFTTAGKNELAKAIQAWTRYAQLTATPDPALATLAARAYVALGNYAGASSAWEKEIAASPSEPKGYECLAVNAYAAGETRKGDLAAAKALKLLTKVQQITTKLTLTQAKSSSTAAKSLAQQC
jgi:tetratricopeptide (TPR) repeat protein